MGFNWTCPYCNHDTTISGSNETVSESYLTIKNSDGYRRLDTHWIVCPNPNCNKTTLAVGLKEAFFLGQWKVKDDYLKTWRLQPQSSAKFFPNYIPRAIIQDYEEACAILEHSPKASATLSRRCLQGMIRDFWKVSKNRLVDEINAIEDKVDPITWQAIDATRKVGNIGAHMEKDINLIIDVDVNEATLLINLIELLIEEWYIHRFEREEKLRALIAMSETKAAITT